MTGLDLAKNVSQLPEIDAAGKVVLRRQLGRGQMEKFFTQLPWGWKRAAVRITGRVFQNLGHEVIMPAAYVKPYVKRNKNDRRDAEGVCEAMRARRCGSCR